MLNPNEEPEEEEEQPAEEESSQSENSNSLKDEEGFTHVKLVSKNASFISQSSKGGWFVFYSTSNVSLKSENIKLKEPISDDFVSFWE